LASVLIASPSFNRCKLLFLQECSSHSLLSTTAAGHAIFILSLIFEFVSPRKVLIMASKYQPIVADEKFHDVFPGRSSTSESLGSTLLEDERDSRDTEPHRRFNSRWLWLGHAVLLSLSFVLFMSAYFTRASTLDYVQRYSAYCMLPIQKS